MQDLAAYILKSTKLNACCPLTYHMMQLFILTFHENIRPNCYFYHMFVGGALTKQENKLYGNYCMAVSVYLSCFKNPLI